MGERNEGQPPSWSCPSCGKEQPVEHKFCVRCGVDRAGNGPESTEPHQAGIIRITPEALRAAARELGISKEALAEAMGILWGKDEGTDNVVFGKLPTAEEIAVAEARAKKDK